ncbi:MULTISPECIES: hypothetical protein [Priestia]|uniref:hypothetical protein n=1 Tax=Priestia TaxID=2800373 RepID=UPI0008156AC4|nr:MULTISPECIES: hypothetical protein [Priestia]SCC52705.1 hypothetical protein GA0061087_10752 [Priestia flexa]
MRVREFQTGDIPQLVHLMDQLGYPTSLEKLEGRFSGSGAKTSGQLQVISKFWTY